MQEGLIIVVLSIDVKSTAHQCIQTTVESIIILDGANSESSEVQIDVLVVEREFHAQ